jgi:dUTP pyrophosphatase
MIVKFKRYHEDAKIPTQAYDKDFCVDLYAVSEEEIAPNVWKYGFGFGLQIERTIEFIELDIPRIDRFGDCYGVDRGLTLDFDRSDIKLSIDIRPRSSVWKTGMVLSNCEGTVDEGYTNEISAIFYHVMPNMPRYKVGDKIAQAKIGFTFPIIFTEVDELNDTERGMKGYGSSGL